MEVFWFLFPSSHHSHNDVVLKCPVGYAFENGSTEISLGCAARPDDTLGIMERTQPYEVECYAQCSEPCQNGGRWWEC